MGTKGQQRRARKREKKKAARAEARARRQARQRTTRRKGTRDASGWPVESAWVSEGWHERGADVVAFLVRRHDDGTEALLRIGVDLAERGLHQAELLSGLPEGQAMARIAQDAESTTLLEIEPTLVAALVHRGRDHAHERGHALPSRTDQALAFLGDLDPEASPYDLHLGDPDEEEVTEEVHRPGPLQRLLGRLGLGRTREP